MARSNSITINILGDADNAKKAFNEVQDAGNKLGSGFARVGKAIGAGVALGAGAAAVGVGALVVDGTKSLVELERIGAQTASVIKSTGGAANVSADGVAKMAEKMERLTGIEQEGVREGANLLLTFTNIKNEAGKGNDIFNQSTKILTDMSVALGTDAKTSAIQLGKALNDPVKGVTALTKVGVSFTDQQKDQIKWMVAAGDTAGAQKVILAELNKEFGGSAEAFGETAAGRMAKFKNALGDVGETLASALLPIMEAGATFLSTKLLPAFQGLADKVGPVFEKATLAVQAFFLAGEEGITSGGWFGKVEAAGVFFSNSVMPIFRAAAEFVRVDLLPGLRMAAEFISGQMQAAWQNITAAFADNREELGQVVAALSAVAGVVGPILVGVLGGAFRLLGLIIGGTIDTIGDIVRAIRWVADTAGWASVRIPMMWDAFKEAFKNAINWIIRRWNALEFRTPSLPGIPSMTIGVPDIPLLAKGGIVTSPTLAMIGEAGPEAVVPLSRAGGMGTTVNVNFHHPLTSRDQADYVVGRLEDFFSRGGVVGNGKGGQLAPA